MQKQIVKIFFAFVILMVFALISSVVFGTKVQENFLFSTPDNCSEVCQRMSYKNYCNSPYLKDGSAGMCNCHWNSQSNTCEGSLASGGRCAL